MVVGEQFSRAGFRVDVRPCSRARSPVDYRAVVVGSAVYDGRWEPSAIDYLQAHSATLAGRAAWLFQRTGGTDPAVTPPLVDLPGNVAEPATFSGDLGCCSADNALWRRFSHLPQSAEVSEWHRVRQWGQGLADHLRAQPTDRVLALSSV